MLCCETQKVETPRTVEGAQVKNYNLPILYYLSCSYNINVNGLNKKFFLLPVQIPRKWIKFYITVITFIITPSITTYVSCLLLLFLCHLNENNFLALPRADRTRQVYTTEWFRWDFRWANVSRSPARWPDDSHRNNISGQQFVYETSGVAVITTVS